MINFFFLRLPYLRCPPAQLKFHSLCGSQGRIGNMSLAISLARQRPTYNGVYGSTTKFLYRISVFKIHLQMNDHIKLITKIRLFREFLEIIIVPSVFFFWVQRGREN